jgi:hypothetical protein
MKNGVVCQARKTTIKLDLAKMCEVKGSLITG